MFTYKLGDWILEFTKKYRIVQDDTTAVVKKKKKTALVLISLSANGNICIERTYYAMIYEVNATEHKITFHTTEEIA